ncbi:MAG: transglutaminase domain-containing protein [Lachnospiraceae bacterium]|nr:transglutaminase domain-containing protein [Lachnospiraceae bacterium]
MNSKNVSAKSKVVVNLNGAYITAKKNNKQIKNKYVKYKGKKYWFSSKGRGFLTVGDKKGDKAVAFILDNTKFKKGMKKNKKLKKLYATIVNKCAYSEVKTPKFKSNWYYKTGFKLSKTKRGKCYDYAALTALCAKSLGLKAYIIIGKCEKNNERYIEHSWVTVDNKVLDSFFEDTDCSDKTNEPGFCLKSYEEVKEYYGYKYVIDDIY